ncbi:guanine nucleotide-binding protein G(i) subunit alpha-2-like [Ursus americanus]|uniref:Guanine nucleotide-binding protein G(I) subunit alpha-2-like n=1 Tax=Ursus maritimus TaxID=29073 RepID=A0A8M1F9W9_URSMA|nr:guanine nucleotide-binding protein G(i) subunit alpha-2-like [Ursus maritimus]XP_045651769.1 guanine nucleotide-binding protein G(i) subunit alpha-2-like [Ursus americanus]
MHCTVGAKNKVVAQHFKMINKNQKDSKNVAQVVKLLLLGAEESGKSTTFKQMKIIHEDSYLEEECWQYHAVLCSNTIQSIMAIVKAMGNLQINFTNPSCIDEARD